MTVVLVAGSYPPIPRPAAAATVESVRRAWAEGYDVIVLSPRPSAAHFAAPITGPLAGRRLDNVRRHSGATRLVLCVEAGLPFEDPAPAWRTALTARSMTRTMGRFDHVTLVIADPTLAAARSTALLRAAAHDVVDDPRSGEVPAGVTLLGPVEVGWQDRAAKRGGQVARAMFGERWGPIRNAVAKRIRDARRVAGR